MHLPPEIIDQIIASLQTTRQCHETIAPHAYDSKRTAPSRRWHRFLDASFKCHGDRNQVVHDGFLPVGGLEPLDSSLRALRCVSRAWRHAVSRLLARRWEACVDLDNPADIVRAAEQYCTPWFGVAPRHIEIRAGQSVRPVIRAYSTSWIDSVDVGSLAEDVLAGQFTDWPRPLGFHTQDSHYLRRRVEGGEEGSADGHRPEYGEPKEQARHPLGPEPQEENQGDRSASHEVLHEYLAAAAQHKPADTAMALSIVFPAAVSNIDRAATEVDIFYVAECYDLAAVEHRLGAILQSGLVQHGDTLFANLTDLYLTLPGTYHYEQLHRTCPPHVRDTVRRLYVGIADATGGGGSDDYLGTDYGWGDQLGFRDFDYSYYGGDDDEHGVAARDGFRVMDGAVEDFRRSYYPPGNLQIRHPNRRHQDAMWTFVASFAGLEALGVKCTHYLKLDSLVRMLREQRRVWTLTKLALCRVYTDVQSLCGLIDSSRLSAAAAAAAAAADADAGTAGGEAHKGGDIASRGTPCPIQRVDLDHVKIYPDGGTWAAFFRFMRDRDAPDLDFFGMDELSYFGAHPDYQESSRPQEDTSKMWSESEDDDAALYAFVEGKAAVARGQGATTMMMMQDYDKLRTAQGELEYMDEQRRLILEWS
ncbi:hypothetical protein Micbo1qcDRAFT_237552 [Microdochium bolleyi]|uniref:Uncharacterized protein n=1 Tax=Microdochium bolleyi TaxID=196109 RepID=A0A136IK34_9PEZI|nr:hypothetical protein Micbo1qcDRAFT_237552 [Microdochium bolleyi]